MSPTDLDLDAQREAFLAQQGDLAGNPTEPIEAE